MKKIRLLLALMISLMMVAAMILPVLAEGEGDESTVVYSGEIGNTGSKVAWEIYSDGKLLLKPVGTTGTLPNAHLSILGSSANDDAISAVWPWHAYVDKITSIVVNTGVKASTEGRHMFNGLKNVTTADLSNLDAKELGVANDMFRGCSALQSVVLPGSFSPKQLLRTFKGCGLLETINLGTTTIPFDTTKMRESGNKPIFDDFGTGDDACFGGCAELKVLYIPNAIVDPGNTSYSDPVKNFLAAFYEANEEMKTLDMSGAQISQHLTRRIFKASNDTLETLILDGATLNYGWLRELFHNVDDSTQIVDYLACQNLKTVSMDGVKFRTGTASTVSAFSLFRKLASLESVSMVGADFTEDCNNFGLMFRECVSLTSVDLSDIDFSNAYKMDQMFYKCTAIKKIDVSGFGELPKIQFMDDFVRGCDLLEELILDNLDNSHIGPTNKVHSVTEDESDENNNITSITGAIEYGRHLGIEKCKNLKILSAKNSNIWMCFNDRGLPGNEYYTSSNINDVLYFTSNKMTFTPDKGNAVSIDTMRDYVDLITDRDGKKGNRYTVYPAVEPLPDANSNINMLQDLNPNGPGHLAPGVYTITTTPWETEELEYPLSNYRIAYIGEVPYRVEGITADDPELVIVNGADNTWINTKVMSRNKWGNSTYTIDRSTNPIRIVYENVAEDIYGERHNVIVSIKKITFKNLDRIPTNPGRTHDGNIYAADEYYRTVLQATKNEGISFRNYVRIGDPTELNEEANSKKAKSGGSGTNIEFTVEVEGAEQGTTYLFKVDDLDVPATQNWICPNKDDACFDELPIGNSTYGIGGEAIVIGNGNDIESLTFAKHTGLKLVNSTEALTRGASKATGNQTVISTGPDPELSWSEFVIQGDATGASYTWTSGIGCTTYVLRNTPRQSGYMKHHVYEDAENLPQEVLDTLPDVKTVYPDGKVVEPETVSETRFVIGEKVYTFNGWDKTSEKIDKKDVTFTGSWTITDVTYEVTYRYEGDLPDKVKETLPDKTTGHKDKDTVYPEYPSFRTITVDNMTYTFEGWDKSSLTIDKGNGEFVGKWKVTENPKYTVEYEYEDDSLPEDVQKTIPAGGGSYYDGTRIEPEDPSDLTVKIGHTTYTFEGWDKTYDTVNGKNVKFIGKWKKTEDPTYTEQYVYVGENLPEDVKITIPVAAGTYYDGDKAIPEDPFSKEVKVTGGKWIFKGWDRTSVIIDGSDAVFVGTWEFIKESTPTPKTGVEDHFGLYISVLFAAFMMLTAAIVILRKTEF